MLHYQGHTTREKILALLTRMGVAISKRQVLRLLTAKLETFQAEDGAVLNAGLKSAPYVTVDDTGARHRGCLLPTADCRLPEAVIHRRDRRPESPFAA
jgi:hypothetical protein